MRYGGVPEDKKRNPDGKSITWLECEEAVAHGKHVLAFVVDDTADWPAEWKDDADLKQAIDEGDYKAASELINAVRRLEELLSDSGLLLPREGKRAGFYHSTTGRQCLGMGVWTALAARRLLGR